MSSTLRLIIAGVVAGALLISSFYGIVMGTVASREARWNREVLCIAVEKNAANTSRFDPRIVELCDEFAEPVPDGNG